MGVSVCVYASVYVGREVIHVIQCPRSPKDIGFPGAGDTGSGEPSSVGAGNQTLERKPMNLRAEVSLQLPFQLLFKRFVFVFIHVCMSV